MGDRDTLDYSADPDYFDTLFPSFQDELGRLVVKTVINPPLSDVVQIKMPWNSF